MYVIRMHALLGSLVLALAAAGCSSPGSDGADSDPNATVSGDQAISDIEGAVCDRKVRCQINPMGDRETCVAFILAASTWGLNSARGIKEAINSGKTSTTRGTLDACLAAIRNRPCDPIETYFQNLPECEAALTGTVAEGGACITDIACQPGSFCFLSDSAQNECAATCVKKGGDKCRGDSDCAEGKFCDQQTCQTPVATPGNAGDDCRNGRRCATGLVCLQQSDNNDLVETCGTVQGDGGACGRNGECASGTVCDGTVPPVRCRALPTRVGENEACQTIGGPLCAPGLVCVPGGDFQPATCMKPKARGESCTKTFECGGLFSLTYCDSTMKCVSRPKAGSPCIIPDPEYGCSLFDAFCDVTDQAHPVCKTFKADGSPCNDRAECGSAGGSYCQTSNPGTPGTCISRQDPICTTP